MSTFPIIINGSNLISDTNNNTYRYTFPVGSVYFKNSKVSVSQVSVYYSWFNITSAYGNNTYSFNWENALTVQYDVTMPDGYYDVASLNSYLQSFCVDNDLYLINAAGDFVYYLEFVENPTYYSVQLNSYPIPTALPAGWSEPISFPGYPPTASTPQLIVNANAFRDIIGFNAGTYPAAAQATNYSKLSDYTPQIAPIQSVILTCSLLNNRYSNPGTILYSFNASGTAFGNLISSEPVEHTFVNIQNGSYSDISISFVDQNFNPVVLQDTNIVVTLLIQLEEDLY